jgi:PAS domain S-box-containing protein
MIQGKRMPLRQEQTMNFNIFHLRSLKTKLTLFTLVIFLIGIWSLAAYSSRMLQEDMQHMLSNQQFSTVSLLAAKVNQEIDGRLRALEKIAGGISPTILDNTVALQTFLEQHILLQSLFNGGVFVTGIDGTATASIPLSAERAGRDYMDRDYIAAALREGKSTVGRPVMGRALTSPVFVTAAPIRDARDNVIGALAGVTDLGKPNFLDNITEGHYGKTGGYLLVAPQHRLIVTASDKSRIMEASPAPGLYPLIDRFLQGFEGTDVGFNPVGVEVLASVKRIPSAGWYLNVSLPTAEAFTPIRTMQQRMMLTASILTLLMGGLTWWMLKRLLSPMHTASRILTTLSDTDQPPQPLPITSQDEIGDLIGGFNRLLETLKQREASLRESEEKHKRMIANISDVIAIMDSDGTLRYKSPNIDKWFGWQPEDLIDTDGWETVHPADVERIQKEFITLLDKDNSVATVEYRYKCNDGSYKLIELTAVNLTNDPIIHGVLMNYHDITERKQAEDVNLENQRRLTDIIEFLPDATLAIDKEKRVIIWNKAIEKMTGVPAAEMIGKGDYAYTIPFYGEARPQLMDLILMDHGDVSACYPNVAREDDSLTVEVFCNALYNNKGAWVFAKASPLHDHSGNIVGAIESIRDITERKRAEQEKAKLEGQIQRAQKMETIGSLAGGIAHDLNNILFPISGLSEMLLDDIPPDTPEHKSIEQIYKSAQRGSDLVKQILAFSRQSNPQKLPIRIQPILKEVMKLAQVAIPKNIEITSRINSDCGMVSGDPTQIHQIAMNLITNAFHATEGKGGTLDISLEEIAVGSFAEKEDLPFPAMPGDLLAGRYACITVSDTGTGIEQSLIDKIFDPYFTTKELGKGTGLGLSVVHGIVKEHGGDIRVYSEVGKGTVFHVYLPLLEDTGDIKAAAFIKQYPTGHERILLVDDEAPIVRMVQMMLEKLGYQITVRTSSPDALAAFKANPDHFDLVISDRGMPNMTGDQLAAELISIRPGIPIILCTGFSNENDVKRAKAMGVKGFLMKPVATGDLATMVRSVLDD